MSNHCVTHIIHVSPPPPQRLCVELEAHTELLAAVTSAGHQLPEGASAAGRPVRQRLAELRTEWDRVCDRLVVLQSELLSIAAPEDGEMTGMVGDGRGLRGGAGRGHTDCRREKSR